MNQSGLRLEKAPFLRIFIPFAIGIIIRIKLPQIEDWIRVLAIVSFVTLVAFSKTSSYFKFSYSWIRMLCWHTIILCAGFAINNLRDETKKADWIGHTLNTAQWIIVTVAEPPDKNGNNIQIATVSNYLIENKNIRPVRGKIKLYLKLDSLQALPEYGDRLLIKNNVKKIAGNSNPGGFDYRSYAADQHLFYQANLFKGEWKLLEKNKGDPIWKILYQLREKMLAAIKMYIKPLEIAGIAEALLLGYKKDLDREMLQAYARTGVVHIIAVSGMHLGIIYWLLTLLFKPIRRWFLQAIFIIAGLWIFSLLAGAGASVLRSALMFTCISIGNNLKLKGNIYNSLAASAVILLIYEPLWIRDIGFQLSYAAVASIVYFQSVIKGLYYSKYKILQHIWEMVAVTLAAQILTLPFCLYHFHQFPLLFPFTNLIAVPLSSLLLLLLIPLPALSFFPEIAKHWGKLIGILIEWMNWMISYADKLPFSIWEGLQISELQTLLLCLFIVFVSGGILNNSKKQFLLSGLTLLIFLFFRTVSFIEANENKMFIIYNIPKVPVFSIWQGREASFFHPDTLNSSSKQWTQQIQPSLSKFRVRTFKSIGSIPEWIQINGRYTIYIPRGIPIQKIDIAVSHPDLVWLKGDPRISLFRLKEHFTIPFVVIDGSNSFRNREKWEKECRELGIPCFRTDLSGAFVKKF